MTVYAYTGGSLTTTVTRDTNTGAVTHAKQTWKVGHAAPILVSSFVTDIRSAGDYRLKINGTVVATVNGVAAAAVAVSFTPAAAVELLPGTDTFELECTSAAVTWYARGNLGTASPVAGVNVGIYNAWEWWQEPASGIFVPGVLNFKVADVALLSGIDHDSLSSGSFAAQTWSVTLDVPLYFFGLLKRLRDADATGYVLSIDAVDVATVVKATGTTIHECAFVPAAPVLLAAGAHTFKLTPSANRRFIYDNGTTSVPSGSGASHTTAWGNWTEASTNKVSAQLWFRLPTAPGVPTAVTADPAGTSIDLDWGAPATGDPATGYEVRIDAGAWTDVGLVLTHTFAGLTGGTTYDVEVRAYNATGTSAGVSLEVETDLTGPTVAYHAIVRVGDLSFEVLRGDVPDPEAPHVLAGVSFDWQAPDNVGWPPAPWQMPPDTLTLRITSPDAELVASVRRLDTVRFAFTPEGYDFAEPLIDFAGLVITAPRITRNPAGGVFLDVTAVDWRHVLTLITVFGLADTDGGEYNQEVGPGFWHVAVPDYGPIGLMRGLASVETPEDPSGNPWGGVYRWIDDALELGRGLPWLTGAMGDIIDPAVDDFDLPPVQNLHVDYEFGQDLITLHDVYSTLGVYPMPVFDPANGDLEGFAFIFVELDGETGNQISSLNAVRVLGEVTWQHGYIPSVVDIKRGGSTSPFDRHWVGEEVGELEPADPELIQRITYADQRVNSFNLVGLGQEKVVRSGWSLYKFEVLGYLQPTVVAGWFTYPQRVLTAVKIESIETQRDPTEDSFLVGRLSRASFRLDASGRWTVTGRLRPHLPSDLLTAILADLL